MEPTAVEIPPEEIEPESTKAPDVISDREEKCRRIKRTLLALILTLIFGGAIAAPLGLAGLGKIKINK